MAKQVFSWRGSIRVFQYVCQYWLQTKDLFCIKSVLLHSTLLHVTEEINRFWNLINDSQSPLLHTALIKQRSQYSIIELGIFIRFCFTEMFAICPEIWQKNISYQFKKTFNSIMQPNQDHCFCRPVHLKRLSFLQKVIVDIFGAEFYCS